MSSPLLYPTLSLRDQVVLITGASSGIGEACAWRFAELGCKLILVARREERLQKLERELTETYGVAVVAISLDVRQKDKLLDLPNALPAEFKEVDILVNNAGLALGVAPAYENDLEDLAVMLDTNVTAVAVLTRAFVPGMVARNNGHVINISSVAGHEAYGGGSMYCATKFALDAFTSSLRHDVVGCSGVRVTAISPGAVKTEFSQVRFKGDTTAADAVYQGIIPLNALDCADNVIYAATRPRHVQIADIIILATLQSSAKGIARVLQR